ncbi:MAG: hypothetical protein HW386_946 [Gammaproteobacteria bacterium]|nr:hypothetical protein [Gammaproteobacteria bacterium]
MNYRNLFIIPALLAAVTANGQTQQSPAERIVEHHMASGNSRNIDEIMTDYADDAILIAPDGAVHKGKQAILASFQQLMTQDPSSIITPTRKIYEGDVGYIVWTINAGQPNVVNGSDTFIIRDGKIVVQTVTILPPPPVPAQPAGSSE